MRQSHGADTDGDTRLSFNGVGRPVPAGSPGDTDVYGARQHAPLMDILVPERADGL
ncbi:MAG: DUF4387 family protein [Gammaproteobacteria bacterium]|nr:DUF4387 family protein [Gammaproteobacteria bacterium]MDX2460305.1 DUF4387 family protein [Gammaproteobacteria bacterium]